MKSVIYTAILLAALTACRHQKSATQSNPAVATTPKDSVVVVNETQTHTQGDVVITTSDYSTSATIIINNPPDDTTVTTVVAVDSTMDTYRLTVSFISKGAGIDTKTQESFEQWLKDYPKHPAYEVTRWGREGEKNYCLKLNELSTREQEIFVRDVRTQLTGKELVFISEYAKCKGKKE